MAFKVLAVFNVLSRVLPQNQPLRTCYTGTVYIQTLAARIVCVLSLQYPLG